jgi:hypothetical protein
VGLQIGMEAVLSGLIITISHDGHLSYIMGNQKSDRSCLRRYAERSRDIEICTRVCEMHSVCDRLADATIVVTSRCAEDHVININRFPRRFCE